MSVYIPDPVIRRLPAYHRYFKELDAQKQIYVSSSDLAVKMGLTASQIRQDVSAFGGTGLQGCGYPVKEMRLHIEKLLGIHRPQRMIIMGAGNLGCALARYSVFSQERFSIAGAFDTSLDVIGHFVGNVEVQSVEHLEDFLKEHPVDIAVLTLPAEAAQPAAERLYAYGIRGFWNFAPVDLLLPKDAAVVNVHLDESLELLSYRMQNPSNW